MPSCAYPVSTRIVKVHDICLLLFSSVTSLFFFFFIPQGSAKRFQHLHILANISHFLFYLFILVLVFIFIVYVLGKERDPPGVHVEARGQLWGAHFLTLQRL